MKQKLLIAAISLATALGANAQDWLGMHADNYSGVYNLQYQPADIVDGRHLFDFNLIGGGFNLGNNYIGLRRSALFSDTAFSSSRFKDLYLVENLDGSNKTAFAKMQAFLPSFSFSWGKNAIALSANAHVAFNVEGVSERLAYMVYRELEDPNYWNYNINNKNFSVQSMGWIDYGLTYGREIFQIKNHYLKGAGTVKLLQGIFAGSMYSENLDVSFKNADTMSIINSDFAYGHSNNFESNTDGLGYNFVAKPGVGFDLGLVYEFRKPAEKYTYAMDGRDDWQRKDKNKYIFKVGLSITDIGAIPFTKGGASRSFTANMIDEDLDNLQPSDVASFDSILVNRFSMQNDSGAVFNMNLPTKINIMADYNIWKGFYCHGSMTIAPRFTEDSDKTRSITTFAITPRFETKWFTFGLPISYNILGNWGMGAHLRLGPLVIGTNDITPLLGKDVIYGANAYFGLKIPIYYGKGLRDKDKDGVSNKLDNCKKEQGAWENKGCPVLDKDGDGVNDVDDKCPDVKGDKNLKGCPDADGDAIADIEDECPNEAGLAAFKGCPDTDKDGVVDSKDDCPKEPGDAKFNGCPDTDGDGVRDRDDLCPDVKGLVERKGCPNDDKDGDGILDKADKCPEVAGEAKFNGCPDTDKDGVGDDTDKCVSKPGPVENGGCPYADADGDGVLDKDDDCPKTPGLKELKGCPKEDKKDTELLDFVVKNLEFESGKDVIVITSHKSLDDLAAFLKSKPNYKISISGHTDNVGTVESNQRLSEKRANAVKDYLMRKGIDGSRLIAKGFGSSVPVADNKTSAGRAKNRRVEIKLVFD